MMTAVLALACFVLGLATLALWLDRELVRRECEKASEELQRQREALFAEVQAERESLQREWDGYEPMMRARRKEVARAEATARQLTTRHEQLRHEVQTVESVLVRLRAEESLRTAKDLVLYAQKYRVRDHAAKAVSILLPLIQNPHVDQSEVKHWLGRGQALRGEEVPEETAGPDQKLPHPPAENDLQSRPSALKKSEVEKIPPPPAQSAAPARAQCRPASPIPPFAPPPQPTVSSVPSPEVQPPAADPSPKTWQTRKEEKEERRRQKKERKCREEEEAWKSLEAKFLRKDSPKPLVNSPPGIHNSTPKRAVDQTERRTHSTRMDFEIDLHGCLLHEALYRFIAFYNQCLNGQVGGQVGITVIHGYSTSSDPLSIRNTLHRLCEMFKDRMIFRRGEEWNGNWGRTLVVPIESLPPLTDKLFNSLVKDQL